MESEAVRDRAKALLQLMAVLGEAAVSGDPITKPYLDADAIRIVDGKPEFHKGRFLEVLATQLMEEVKHAAAPNARG